jgi:hypothetical protein
MGGEHVGPFIANETGGPILPGEKTFTASRLDHVKGDFDGLGRAHAPAC